MQRNTNDKRLENLVFSGEMDFERLALELCNFQYHNNDIYHAYCDAIHVNVEKITTLNQIPFLPIGFFKTKEIKTTSFEPQVIFESSGTTGSVNSRHFIKDLPVYKNSFLQTFGLFYGDIKKYCILGLLPSYLERKNASLVYMVDTFIKESTHEKSGFYLHDLDELFKTLQENEKNKQPTILIGVTYALLDLAEQYPMKLDHTIIMETGGMKGRRKEISRQELHSILEQNLGISSVHSEYGMTELLSQSYSKSGGIFYSPPWMKIMLRPEDDPLTIISIDPSKKTCTGAVNIIDLANIYSCSFIATDDMGSLYADGSFEIIGRMENSDIRGCGLMLFET